MEGFKEMKRKREENYYFILPNELAFKILCHCDVVSVLTFRATCKTWNEISKTGNFISGLCRETLEQQGIVLKSQKDMDAVTIKTCLSWEEVKSLYLSNIRGIPQHLAMLKLCFLGIEKIAVGMVMSSKCTDYRSNPVRGFSVFIGQHYQCVKFWEACIYKFVNGEQYYSDGVEKDKYVLSNGDLFVGEVDIGLPSFDAERKFVGRLYIKSNGCKLSGKFNRAPPLKNLLATNKTRIKLLDMGILKWPNGDLYLGEWRNGKRHGKGTLYLANGQVVSQTWAQDEDIYQSINPNRLILTDME